MALNETSHSLHYIHVCSWDHPYRFKIVIDVHDTTHTLSIDSWMNMNPSMSLHDTNRCTWDHPYRFMIFMGVHETTHIVSWASWMYVYKTTQVVSWYSLVYRRLPISFHDFLGCTWDDPCRLMILLGVHMAIHIVSWYSCVNMRPSISLQVAQSHHRNWVTFEAFITSIQPSLM